MLHQNFIIHGLLKEYVPPFYLQNNIYECIWTGGGWPPCLPLYVNRLPSIGHNQCKHDLPHFSELLKSLQIVLTNLEPKENAVACPT